MYWFTADNHFDHANIIRYCNRPFTTVGSMNAVMIDNWNSVVHPVDDVVYVLGDFCMGGKKVARKFFSRLNGRIIVVPGSHDRRWIDGSAPTFSRKVTVLFPLTTITIEKQPIVLCHYAMRVWNKSHYNSWQLYGHSHGKLPPMGKQHDVGVDNNNFYPVSFDQIKKIMAGRPDNFNLVKGKRK